MLELSSERGEKVPLQDEKIHLSPRQELVQTPPSASPNKPRLLWRGSLHLSDGTELSGLAIISTVQPAFSSSSSSSSNSSTRNSKRDLDQFNHVQDPQSPFTLSTEQQDEMCLSIEMVRHAPLRVVDVVENGILKDESGKLALQSNMDARRTVGNPTSQITSNNTNNSAHQNIHITFEAAGNVRLYIDPDQHATVTFFDRLFAYEFDNDQKDRLTGTGNCSTSALTFSLDKSFTSSINFSSSFDSQMGSQDPFGDHANFGSAYHINSTGIMEAAVIGIERSDLNASQKPIIELHIGRKVVKRIKNTSLMESQPSMSNALTNSINELSIPPRPDDPAPRLLPLKRPQKSLKHTTSLTSLFSRSNSFKSHQSVPSKFVVPAQPSLSRSKREGSQKRESISSEDRDLSNNFDTIKNEAIERSNPSSASTRKRGGNHTPGRRGEKRPKKNEKQGLEIDPFIVGVEESMEQSGEEDFNVATSSTDLIMIKKEEPDALLTTSLKENPVASSIPDKQSSAFEEKNRSLIKKLVHYQLLGKGVERHESAYSACFGTTCQGAMVALRKFVKVQPIDKQLAASIIEKHLEMYL